MKNQGEAGKELSGVSAESPSPALDGATLRVQCKNCGFINPQDGRIRFCVRCSKRLFQKGRSMIKACNTCGGLYTTDTGESYAGTPCRCLTRQPDAGHAPALYDVAVKILTKLDSPTLSVTALDADELRAAIALANGQVS